MLFCNLQMITLIFFHFNTILSGELQPAHLGKGAWLEWTHGLVAAGGGGGRKAQNTLEEGHRGCTCVWTQAETWIGKHMW